MQNLSYRPAVRASLCVAVLLAIASMASAQSPCGQPLSQGDGPTIRDCIQIGRASVDVVPCADCVCDTNGSGNVTITDALRCLIYVIGADVTLDCPTCESTTTTVPTCAPCSNVLFGTAEEADLCEASRPIFETMMNCPCGQCGDECSGVICPSANILPDDVEPNTFSCLGCLRDLCRPATIDCIED